MDDEEGSDSVIITDETGEQRGLTTLAEFVEGRTGANGRPPSQSTYRTQRRGCVSQAAWRSRRRARWPYAKSAL